MRCGAALKMRQALRSEEKNAFMHIHQQEGRMQECYRERQGADLIQIKAPVACPVSVFRKVRVHQGGKRVAHRVLAENAGTDALPDSGPRAGHVGRVIGIVLRAASQLFLDALKRNRFCVTFDHDVSPGFDPRTHSALNENHSQQLAA